MARYTFDLTDETDAESHNSGNLQEISALNRCLALGELPFFVLTIMRRSLSKLSSNLTVEAIRFLHVAWGFGLP